jgi:DNA-binding transcriptional LysR family regulator
MNLRSVDLNLLVIFQALVEERSVSNAAGRLGMSQSAVSHALRRLRDMLKDELLVRNGDRMQLTQYAVKLSMLLKGAMCQIESALEVDRDFDPHTSRHTFHVGISEYAGIVLLPALMKRLRLEFPGVGLKVEPMTNPRISDAVIFDGIQIRLSTQEDLVPRTSSQRLICDHFVTLMRADHPAASSEFSLERYLEFPHIKVTGVGSSVIDETLAQLGFARRVMFEVPSWLEMVNVIETTDLIAAVPSHWMRMPSFHERCVSRTLPLPNLKMTIDAIWHARNDDNPGHRWFRTLLAETYATLTEGVDYRSCQ